MQKKIQDYKTKLPVIEYLCTEGLRPRHIKRINDAFGASENVLNMPWSQVYNMGGEDLIPVLEEIASEAQKEFGIEKTIGNIKNDWKKLNFATKQHKQSGLILEGTAVEELQAALDDHLIKTQTMKSSPFAKEFKDEIEEFERKLARTQTDLEVWLKLQQVWMYLEPVFKSDDIMKQMPVEG